MEAREIMPDLEREVILAEAKPFDPLSRLGEFTAKYPFAVRILRVGGVHPTEEAIMDNPYTSKPHNESFANVGEHCLAVASLANVLATKLHQIGVLSVEDVDMATSRGLVHDANKRLEIMRRNALKEGVIQDAYSPQAYDTIVPILLSQGIDPKLVYYLAKAGKETGHLSIKDFLTLSDGTPTLDSDRLVDKIIHLADDMTSTSIPQPNERASTLYLTPWERMVASDFPNRYPFLWKEGLAFDMQGEVATVQEIETANRSLRWIRPYAYWQPWLSNEICREIQTLVDPENKQRPEYFVKDLVNNTLVPSDL